MTKYNKKHLYGVEIVELLRDDIKKNYDGCSKNFCQAEDFSESYICEVLGNKKDVGPRLAKHYGYERGWIWKKN